MAAIDFSALSAQPEAPAAEAAPEASATPADAPETTAAPEAQTEQPDYEKGYANQLKNNAVLASQLDAMTQQQRIDYARQQQQQAVAQATNAGRQVAGHVEARATQLVNAEALSLGAQLRSEQRPESEVRLAVQTYKEKRLAELVAEDNKVAAQIAPPRPQQPPQQQPVQQMQQTPTSGLNTPGIIAALRRDFPDDPTVAEMAGRMGPLKPEVAHGVSLGLRSVATLAEQKARQNAGTDKTGPTVGTGAVGNRLAPGNVTSAKQRLMAINFK